MHLNGIGMKNNEPVTAADASTRSPAHAETTAQQGASGPMHLVVDLTRCQAYAQCCFLAPDVFRLHGEEALWYDPSPDPAQRDQVLRAAAACPVQAIIVEAPETSYRQPRKQTGRTDQKERPHAARQAE